MLVSIETAHNVTIDYDIASLGDRVIAAAIDLVIQVAYILSLIFLFNAIEAEPGTAMATILVLPALLYDLLCEVFFEGQSFGKKAMRIKVVRLDGTEPTLGSYLLRWILRLVDSGLSFVGLIVIAVNGKGQRLGDIAAGTTVIKLRSRLSLSETLLPELSERYVPTYHDVVRLNDRDVALIRELWAAGRRQSSGATMMALSRRVASVIGVDPPADAEKFLETVVRDYTFFTQGLE